MDQRQQYIQIKVKNTSREDRLIMLYDAMIDYLEEAQICLGRGASAADRARGASLITWSIDILTELNGTLRHDKNPKLCNQLSALYLFFTQELADSLVQCKTSKITSVLALVTDLRSAWVEAKAITSQPVAELV